MHSSFAGRRNLSAGFGNFVLHGGQLALLGLGLEANSASAWPFVSVGIALLSLIGWTVGLRRWRILGGTPTSRVATAAQGYVELVGTGVPLLASPVSSPLDDTSCLWFRYLIEVSDSDNKWRKDEEAYSDECFILKDGSGDCVIDPEGAEIVTSSKRSWLENGKRYTQWMLMPNDKICALGQFSTRSGLQVRLDRDADVKLLLAEWKRDNPQLLKHFDRNKDGELSVREWDVARLAANREIDKQHRETRATDVHTLHYPADGRLFLLSNIPADKLAGSYRFLTSLHLVIFFVSLAAAAMLGNGL